jgi:AcrR family transcriptional regulator
MALTRDRIVDAGLALADTHGLGAVSMRRVAGELGVKAMSLYNHIAGKDALLDGMLERVLDEVMLPVAGRDWEGELRRCALSLHDAIRGHPWACGLAMAPAAFPSALGARARYIEAILRTLREAGFTAEQAYHGYHALDGHTIGITTWELGHTVADQSRIEDARRQIADGDYPYLLEHAREHEAGHQSAFAFGLDLVFDGLRRTHPT